MNEGNSPKKPEEPESESEGKAYERLVDSLYLGDEEPEPESAEDSEK